MLSNRVVTHNSNNINSISSQDSHNKMMIIMNQPRGLAINCNISKHWIHVGSKTVLILKTLPRIHSSPWMISQTNWYYQVTDIWIKWLRLSGLNYKSSESEKVHQSNSLQLYNCLYAKGPGVFSPHADPLVIALRHKSYLQMWSQQPEPFCRTTGGHTLHILGSCDCSSPSST